MVPDAYHELPDLPGEDGPGHFERDLRPASAVADVKFELTESYAPWLYCVQYRESDFNFVSRLMEDEGIYYFFKHEEGRHTMVLADSISAHTAAPDSAEIPFIDPEPCAIRTRTHQRVVGEPRAAAGDTR